MLQADEETAKLGRCAFCNVHRDDHTEGTNAHTDDKTTSEDGVVPCCCSGSTLDDHSQNKDTCVDDDSVLSRDNLCKEARVQRADPCTEFEDGGQPALLGLILGIDAHVIVEGGHRQDAGKDTLIVSIKKATQAGEGGDEKDANIVDEC